MREDEQNGGIDEMNWALMRQEFLTILGCSSCQGKKHR